MHLQVEQGGARASHGLKLFKTIAQKLVYDLLIYCRSHFKTNSHLVFVDVACRHQWTGTDNAVQRTVHNLCANIQCHSHLHNHCFSNHDRSWHTLLALESSMLLLCLYPHYVTLLFWFYQKQICAEGAFGVSHPLSCSDSSVFQGLTCLSHTHSLSTPITSLWWDQYGPSY